MTHTPCPCKCHERLQVPQCGLCCSEPNTPADPVAPSPSAEQTTGAGWWPNPFTHSPKCLEQEQTISDLRKQLLAKDVTRAAVSAEWDAKCKLQEKIMVAMDERQEANELLLADLRKQVDEQSASAELWMRNFQKNTHIWRAAESQLEEMRLAMRHVAEQRDKDGDFAEVAPCIVEIAEAALSSSTVERSPKMGS